MSVSVGLKNKLRDTVDSMGRRMILTKFNDSKTAGNIMINNVVADIPSSMMDTIMESILYTDYPDDPNLESPS